MKIKGYFFRWVHLMGCLIKLDFKHQAYTKGISYTFLGIEVWFKANEIGCTCGKVFYKRP